METLRIPITSVPESGISVSVRFKPDDVQPANIEVLPLVEGSLAGKLAEVGGEFLFTGRVSAAYLHPCDRCLEDAHAEVESDVIWHFATGAEEAPLVWDGDDDDTEYTGADSEPELPRPIDNGVIDLAPAIWEELVVTAPSKFICRDDCKGLCSRCGANLNLGECACSPENMEIKSGHQGFQKLAELYPELMNKPTED